MRGSFLLFGSLPLLLHAQQFEYDWSGVINATDPGTAGYIDDLEVNTAGYAVGYGYMGGVTGFDLDLTEQEYLITCNVENAFLCVYNGDGAVYMGGPLTSSERVLIHDLEVLPNNDFLITLSGSAPIDMEPLFGVTEVGSDPPNNGQFIAMARYTMEGALLWAYALDGTYMNGQPRIEALPDGSFYMSTGLSGAGASSFVDLDPGAPAVNVTLSNYNSFIAYYSADAELIWHYAYHTGSTGFGTNPRDIGVDSGGNLIVAGLQQTDADFDPAPGDQTLPFTEATAFIAKYTQGGELLWVSRFIGTEATQNVWATNVLVNAQDQIFVTGRFFEGSLDLDPTAAEELVPTAGGHDIWMVRLNPEGDRVWARTFGTSAFDISEDMCFLGNGDILLGQKDQVAQTGAFPLSIIRAADGDVAQQFPQVWQQTIGALGSGQGQVYISGQFNGLAMGDLTSQDTILQGGDAIYLSHYDSEVTTALPSPAIPSELVISPNPASAQIMLRAIRGIPLGTPVHLMDAAGRFIRTVRWSGNGTVIDVSDLAAGTYQFQCAELPPQRLMVMH